MDIKKVGEMVEGYRVMAELGRGAASIIYLVQEPKSKQVWALKHVAKESPKDQRFLDQTESEYQIASQLDHPRIRKIERLIRIKPSMLSMQVSELYLVMEMVDGASLEREPPKTFEEAAGIFEQVADAIAYMNAKGFVHADMKPNNIVVDNELCCKVIDLGQSCKLGTVKGRIQGTPDYIAPEQVHLRPLTEKTDIYNLGATMYWVLTHHYVPTALAKGDSLLPSVDDNLIEKATPTTVFNPRVPELFDKLIMECVEVDPAKRPNSMRDVANRLNLIRGKLAAEAELRRSGLLPRFEPDQRKSDSDPEKKNLDVRVLSNPGPAK
ncbi:MAG: serine/threonine protein kinase [Phycisphaerales bacterium]|nr:serine/threonine protein kinase [Phycisphaerales bacterium]